MLKSSSQNYLWDITCFLMGYICHYLCASSFQLCEWPAAGVAADALQAAPRHRGAWLGTARQQCHRAVGAGLGQSHN